MKEEIQISYKDQTVNIETGSKYNDLQKAIENKYGKDLPKKYKICYFSSSKVYSICS